MPIQTVRGTFDAETWKQEMASSGPGGRTRAEQTKRVYLATGIPRSHLKKVDEEGRDGTVLTSRHFKAYVPQPIGEWGMVFEMEVEAGEIVMAFRAFGYRHPEHTQQRAPSVYARAHHRLHGVWPGSSNFNPPEAR